MDGKEIRQDIFAQRVPLCPKCHAAQSPTRPAKKRKKSHGKAWQSDEESDEDTKADARPAGWGVLKVSAAFLALSLHMNNPDELICGSARSYCYSLA